jgi:hypothetical protein
MEKKKVRRISILLEFEDSNESDRFEGWLKQYIDFRTTVLTDDSELYESGETFRRLCSEVKKAKRLRDDYKHKTKKR